MPRNMAMWSCEIKCTRKQTPVSPVETQQQRPGASRYWCIADTKSEAGRPTCEPQVQQKVLWQLFLSSQVEQLNQLTYSRQGRQSERCQFPRGSHHSGEHVEKQRAEGKKLWLISFLPGVIQKQRGKQKEKHTSEVVQANITSLEAFLVSVCSLRIRIRLIGICFNIKTQ